MDKKTAGVRRFISIKNLILMAVILVVILASVFAWYTNNNTVTASGTSISAKAADNVELALPEIVDGKEVMPRSNDKWSTELNFSASGYLKNLVKDITSDGKQFVMPNFEAAKGLKDGREVITSDVWVDGLSSKAALTNNMVNDDDQYNYISIDFYARAKQETINVTEDSFLAAGSELGIKDDGQTESDGSGNVTSQKSLTESLTDGSPYRVSTYGTQKFSADAVVGAIRVSLCCAPVIQDQNDNTISTGDSSLSFLWLPRPDIFLQTDNNANNWQLLTGIKPSQNENAALDNIAKETYTHSFYEGKTVNSVKKGLELKKYADAQVLEVEGTTANEVFHVTKITGTDANVGTTGYTPKFGQSAVVAQNADPSSTEIQFTAGTGENDKGYYIYKLTLNIWIEGEDAEARRSMNKGLFDLELDFGS